MLMGNRVGFRSMSDRNRITKFFHNCFGPSQVRRFDKQLESLVTEFFDRHSSNILQHRDNRYLAHDATVY